MVKKDIRKRQLKVREWTPCVVNLSRDEVNQLTNSFLKEEKDVERKYNKCFSVQPTGKEENSYTIIAKNVVGTLELETVEVFIEPKIEIKNLLFLLCYSWSGSTWNRTLSHFSESSENLAELMKTISTYFVDKLQKLLKRGLLQGYQEKIDTSTAIKGRISWSDQIRKHQGQLFPVEVKFDEFTEDIEENRLIKAAIYKLLHQLKKILADSTLQQTLRFLDRRLQSITLINYDAKHLPVITFNSINNSYRDIIPLAKFILQDISYDFKQGEIAAPGFLIYMPRIFEDFIVTALRQSNALKHHFLTKNTFPQGKPVKFDSAGNILIKPDFSLWENGICKFVGDVKYKWLKTKPKKGEKNVMTGIANTPDLYQMFTYIMSLKLKSGLIIYAESKNLQNDEGKPIEYEDIDSINGEAKLRRRALNVNVKPNFILSQIECIAREIDNDIFIWNNDEKRRLQKELEKKNKKIKKNGKEKGLKILNSVSM